jgi:sugar/nucleoside kinase (ribokinase family)
MCAMVSGKMVHKKKIVVVGSSNTDMIIKAPRIPAPGETVLGGQFSMAAGGKGAIEAVAAARAGGEVVFIARVGADFFGERAIKSFLAPNEFEAQTLTGIRIKDDRSAGLAANNLLAQGVETVLITLGPRGAFLATDDIRELIPGFSVRVVDSMGAGDVFCGALAVAPGENKGMKDTVTFANAAAAISVTRLGAQPSIPRRREIDKFLSSRIIQNQ